MEQTNKQTNKKINPAVRRCLAGFSGSSWFEAMLIMRMLTFLLMKTIVKLDVCVDASSGKEPTYKDLSVFFFPTVFVLCDVSYGTWW